MQEFLKQISELTKDVVIADQKATAAHKRIDTNEERTRHQWLEVSERLAGILKKLDKLQNYVSFQRGAFYVVWILAMILGSLASYGIPLLLRKFLAE